MELNYFFVNKFKLHKLIRFGYTINSINYYKNINLLSKSIDFKLNLPFF
jgi:hypothetical protein